MRDDLPENALDACPFCETPNRPSPWPNIIFTFYIVNLYSASVHPDGARETVSCMKCDGVLYDGPPRPRR